MGVSMTFYKVSEKEEEVELGFLDDEEINIFNRYFHGKLIDIPEEYIDYEKTLEEKIGKSNNEYKFFVGELGRAIYVKKDFDMKNYKEVLKDSENDNVIVYDGELIEKIEYSKGIKAEELYWIDRPFNSNLLEKLEKENNGVYINNLICSTEELNKLYKVIDKEYKSEFKQHIMKKFEEGKTFIYID